MGYHFEHDWFSPNIEVFEKRLAHLKGTPCRVLEIGAHDGLSTTWMLENILTHVDARIVAVDLGQRLNPVEGAHAVKLDLRTGATHAVILALPTNTFDFAYIDGGRQACDVLEAAVMAFPCMRVGGVMAFNAYLWDERAPKGHGTPKAAVDAFLACHANDLEVLEQGRQMWVRKVGGRVSRRPARIVSTASLRPV